MKVYIVGYMFTDKFIFIAIFNDEIDAWQYVAYTMYQGSRVFSHLDLFVIDQDVY